MKFSTFASTRLAQFGGQVSYSRLPASLLLKLSIAGVSLSLGVMLISVAIILGFKRQIHDFAYSQTGHISVYPLGSNWLVSNTHFLMSPRLIDSIRAMPSVRVAYPLLQRMALLKTEQNYEGLMLYGVDVGFDHNYFASRMIEGILPRFSSLDEDNPIVLPSQIAQSMGIALGDKVRLYFLDNQIRVRIYRLVGIYNSSGLDQVPALCASSTIRKMDKLEDSEYNRLMIMLTSSDDTEETIEHLQMITAKDPGLTSGAILEIASARLLLPDIFNWLDLLDSNVYLLLVLMTLVGGFTMITGLIIVVLDKVRQIGILKSLGASDTQVQTTFFLIAFRLMLWAVLWGNLVAGVFCWGQKTFEFITLDPRNYFMDAVPIAFDLWVWLGIDVGAVILIMLMVLIPTRIVSQISPTSVMRFD